MLANIGPEALPVLFELIVATENRDFLIRRNAVRAIGNIGPAANEALPELQALHLNDPFPSIRSAAADAISKLSPQ